MCQFHFSHIIENTPKISRYKNHKKNIEKLGRVVGIHQGSLLSIIWWCKNIINLLCDLFYSIMPFGTHQYIYKRNPNLFRRVIYHINILGRKILTIIISFRVNSLAAPNNKFFSLRFFFFCAFTKMFCVLLFRFIQKIIKK